MAFLLINGIEIKAMQASRSVVRMGSRSRAFSGMARGALRAQKLEWSCSTAPLDAREKVAVAGLLEGRGHALTFNVDLYTSKGLAPFTTGTYTLPASSPTPKFGAKCLSVTAGTMAWATKLPGAWTVLLWKYNGSTWDRWSKDSSGACYKNGAVAADASGVTVPTGSMALGVGQFDDVVVLPFLIPTAWHGAALWGRQSQTQGWSALPVLNGSGTMLAENGTDLVSVLGEVQSADTLSFASPSGAWVQAGETLSFTLYER